MVYGAGMLRWFSEEAVRVGGDDAVSGDGSTRVIVTREPVGPCVLVTRGTSRWPWARARSRRLSRRAAVFKPAAITPLTSLALVDIFREAGLPDGVLNVVTTSRASSVVDTWMSSGIARKVSFTGSTEVGKALLRQATDNVMRSSMELGGNAPFIVLADADIEKAVDGAMTAKMCNMGEACTAVNRFFIHRSVAGGFSGKLAKRIHALVSDVVTKGARILTGGTLPDGPGYFYPPTVLVDVPTGAELMHEEIFGPVAAVTAFDSEDEVLRLANDTEWDLAGYVYTQALKTAQWFSEELEVGMVGINTGLVFNPAAPFGGIKQSGLGRGGGKVGIEEFLEVQYTAIAV